ncbi:unnamed protein product [Clavelina lepadiformis]|uniref:Uncharacterized protein n=1 Tax=Clavelina lepadiformis TaxID=159417 RepID=A0ABP0GCV9_CLALP
MAYKELSLLVFILLGVILTSKADRSETGRKSSLSEKSSLLAKNKKNEKTQNDTVGRKLNSKMSSRKEMMADIASAVVRKAFQAKAKQDYACSPEQYYDGGTGKCEDCEALCKKFSPKMCRVNCPATYTAVKYHIPDMVEHVDRLEDKYSKLENQILAIENSNLQTLRQFDEMKRNGDELESEIETLRIWLIVVTAILAVIAFLVIWLICRCLRAKKKPGKEGQHPTSPPSYTTESSKSIDSLPDNPDTKSSNEFTKDETTPLNISFPCIQETQEIRKDPIITSPVNDDSFTVVTSGPQPYTQAACNDTQPKT